MERDKQERRRFKDVGTLNDVFQRIILDIPNISIVEQTDRYKRGLKPYIWRELCSREHTSLNEAMRGALRKSLHIVVLEIQVAYEKMQVLCVALSGPLPLR